MGEGKETEMREKRRVVRSWSDKRGIHCNDIRVQRRKRRREYR